MKLKKLLSVFLALAMLFGVCSVPVFADGNVAKIGTTEYATLADAIAAVPTDGTETTITMIADETLAAGDTLTIAANKNIVLDLNGKSVAGSASTKTASFYFITNKGTLEIADTSANGDGKITLTVTDANYSYESVTIYNLGGTLILTEGKIENTAGGLGYAVNNSSNAWGTGDDKDSVFNMNGGIVSAPQGDAALRVYQNCSKSTTPISHNTVNITGGTILDSGIFLDTYIYEPDANTTGEQIVTAINISGGEIHGLIDLKLRHPFNTSLNITDGTFVDSKLWVRKHSEWNANVAEPTNPMVHITGGKFSFVPGKAFGLAYDCGATSWDSYETPYDISGGKFNVEPAAAFIASGYEAVANTDDDKTTYGYKIGTAAVYVAQIGDVKYESLADAIAAVPTNGTVTTITMIADYEAPMDHTDSSSGGYNVVSVAKDQNVILDLNGKTITGVIAYDAKNSAVITVSEYGTLTVRDTSAAQTGTITHVKYDDGVRVGNWAAQNWQTDILFNHGGTLTVESGTIANTANGNICYAIDTSNNYRHNDATLTITGGTITSQYCDTIRMRLDAPVYGEDSGRNVINVSGGTISGRGGIWAQVASGTAPKGRLTITGGTITGGDWGTLSYYAGSGVSIDDFPASITGGKITGTVDLPQENYISGGKFSQEPEATRIAEGYEAVAISEDPYFFQVVPAVTYVAQIDDVKYETLEAAIEAAQANDTVTLLADVNVGAAVVFISKSITLDGGNHTLTTTANRAIRVNQSNVTVTIRNLTIAGNTERAVQVDSDKDHVTLTLDHVTAAATMYTVNICGDVDDLVLNVTGCDLTGWGVINLWGKNGTVSVSNSTLIGINDKGYNAEGWNDFGVIIMEGDTTGQTTEHSAAYNVTVTNCNITANSTTGNRQFVVLHNNPSAYNNLALDECTITLGNENCHFYLDQSVQSATKIRATYMAGTLDVPTLPDGYLYVPVADNYKLIAQAVAVIGETPYASLKDAVEAATAGATIELIADDDVSLTSGGEIVINKSLTINGNDHTIYGTPDQTGSNYIYITGSGTVTINGLNVEGFGYKHATDADHAPIYVSSNFTGTVNLIGVSVSKFNRGGIFLYGGNFNVEGCDIDCANSRSGAFTKGIEIKGSASGTILDTDIYNMERSSTTYSTAGIEIYGNGSIVVDNCTISSNVDTHTTTKGTYGIVSSRVGANDPSGGALQVKDTVIDVTNAALSVADSDEYGPVNNYSIEVTGCTFSNYIATWSATSTVTINSGDFAEDVYADAGTIIIHGGKFNNFAPDTDTGSIVIDGGKFSADPSDYVASGYTAVAISEDPYFFEVVPASAVVARIGNTEYTTLAAAFAAAQDGDTITLLGDYDMEGNEPGYGYTTSYLGEGETTPRNNMIVISGNNITFDLDGHTLSNLFNNTFKVTGTNITITNGTMVIGQVYYGSYDSNGPHYYSSPRYASYTIFVEGATNLVIDDLTTTGGINVAGGSTATINDLAFSGTCYYAICAQENSVVTLTGGTYDKATNGDANYLFWVENGSVMNITGGNYFKGSATFRNETNPVITGGIFDFDPTNFGVADGYEAVALTGDNAGKWQVGAVVAGNLIEETEPENITEGYDATYTVQKQVVDADENPIEGGDGIAREVNVRVETDEAIPANAEIASGNTAAEILDNLKMDKVLDSVVDAVADANDTLNVHIQVVRDTPPIVENTITYEVHPIALIYVNDATTPTETVTITNDKLESGAVFTVTLPVPEDLATLVLNGNGYVKVKHTSADYGVSVMTYPLKGEAGNYYVQFKVSHFSQFELAVDTIDTIDQKNQAEWGASLILQDMVAINLHVSHLKDRYGNVEADPSRFTVKYTFRGETNEVALSNANDNAIIVAKVAAKELVDEVTLELYYDGVLIKGPTTYSARTYCMNKTDTTKSDYEANLDTLCRALLEYGAAAQERFNYKTDDLANKNLNVHAALSDVPAYSYAKDGELALSASLSLKENTQINVYFLPAAGCDSEDYTATVGGQPVTITDSGSYCRIAVPGIAARNLGASVTVVITNKNTSEITTLQYSPMTWAYNKQGTETTELEYKIARTLYAYYLAAAAYFAN